MFRRSLPLFVLVLGAVLISGCSWFKETKDTEEDPYATAADLYSQASRALRTGNYEEAIKQFETLEARYPFGPYAEQSKLEAAYAYYKYGEQESAIATVDRYLQLHPRGENVDYALYLKGLANLKRGASLTDEYVKERDPSRRDQGALQEAFNAFTEVVQRFPSSKYAEDSQNHLLELRNLMAEHELYMAQYYLKRGAWLSAANRAQGLLERYQGAPSMPEALKIMVQAYTRLGLTDLAEDARKVLELNYPEVAKTLK